MTLLRKIAEFFKYHQLPHSKYSIQYKHGYTGEYLARKYIVKNGMTLIDWNWRGTKGEIDIIAKEGSILVFIEVKARKYNANTSGYHAVNKKKKEILRKTCNEYMRSLRIPPKHIRFDIIEVRLGEKKKPVINHYKNIMLFSKFSTTY